SRSTALRRRAARIASRDDRVGRVKGRSMLRPFRSHSAPPPETPNVVVQHEELLEHRHPFALPPELREQLAQPSPPGDVEPEGLGKILLRMGGGVGRHVIWQRRGDTATLE